MKNDLLALHRFLCDNDGNGELAERVLNAFQPLCIAISTERFPLLRRGEVDIFEVESALHAFTGGKVQASLVSFRKPDDLHENVWHERQRMLAHRLSPGVDQGAVVSGGFCTDDHLSARYARRVHEQFITGYSRREVSESIPCALDRCLIIALPMKKWLKTCGRETLAHLPQRGDLLLESTVSIVTHLCLLALLDDEEEFCKVERLAKLLPRVIPLGNDEGGIWHVAVR